MQNNNKDLFSIALACVLVMAGLLIVIMYHECNMKCVLEHITGTDKELISTGE